MSRALWVELTRLRWRRAAVVLVGAALVVPILIALNAALSQSPPDSTALARAERQAQREIARCEKHPDQYGIADSDQVHARCQDAASPFGFIDEPTLDLASEREYGAGPGAVAVVGVLMFLLGTTFAGHDWSTGSMSNQLLFQPRRLRLWAAKAAALVLTALVTGVVALTAVWLILAARYRSGDAPLPDGVLRAGLEQGWRGAAVAAAAAWCGYALTMLSRSTVFTLGLLFGVSVAAGILINTVVDDPGPYDPTINISAVVKDGTSYYVDIPQACFDQPTSDGGGSCDQTRFRSLAQGTTYLGVVAVALGLGSAWSFRRRDVG